MKKTTQTFKFTSINNQPNPTPASSETKKHFSGVSSVSFGLGKQVRIVSLLLIALLLFSTKGWGQSVFDWFDTAPDGNWRRGADGARWTGGLWDEPGFGVLRFNNNHQLTMTNNVAGTYSQHSIIFGSSNTSNRTISGNTVRFYDLSSTDPKIENQSSGSHTINFNIEGDGATDPLEMNPTSGNLTFGGTVNNQGTDIFVFGNNGNTITYNGVISGAGKFIIKQNSKAVFNATNTYTGNTELDAGELWIGTSGDISSSSSIFLGNGGSTATVAKLWLSNSSGGTTFSRNITVNNGNTTTRYIGGINTSGTHTLSGNITNNSSGGVYLSAELAGGTTAFSGVVSGSNPVITSGAGTLILSGSSANTYSGVTTFDAATTVLNKSANTIAIPTNGTLNNGKTLRTDAANQWGTGTPPLLTINGNGIFNLNNNNQKVALASSSSSASVTLGSATLNIDNTATDTYEGTISGTGGVLKSNNGTQILTNTGLSYTGSTTITAGTLTLNPSANATFASQVNLNGGTLSTSGITATTTWTSSSTLNLTASSTIALSSGTNHTLTFAASNAVAWTAGQILTITGWTGSIGSSGTGGKIFIGNSASGLTSTQLSQIVFTGFGGAMQLATGEIVPNGVITWVNNGVATAWYTSANWNPNTLSGNWLTSNIAQFQNSGTSVEAGINMNSAQLSIGSIEVTSVRSRALTIGNSSTSASGSLTLNGQTLNSIANTIISNSSSSLLTIQNTAVDGNQTMGIVLGNATNNLINIDGTGGVTISSIISGASRNLTKGGSGSGVLTLSAANSYTGSTTISTGTLRLGISNAIPVGGTGIILNGGTLNTGASTGFSLGSSSTNVGTLTLSTSSTIALGTGDHSLYFSGASFTAGQTLTITGWTGTPGASGTGGKIFIGSSASLTSSQLAQISFSGVNGIAIQLASGEIVPTSTFYSKSTGSLNDLSSWGTNTDGTGIAPANFTSNGITYNIRNNATPTIGASWTVSGTGSKIVVGDGTNACNFTVPGSLTVTSPTTEVSNNGTITRTTTGANSWGTLTFASGAKYIHNTNGGTIPTATWNSNSTLQVNGLTNGTMSGLNQAFGNVNWDCSSQTAGVHLGSSFSIQSGATFTLTASNTGSISILNDAASTSSITASWAGNLKIDGGTFNVLRSNSNSSNHDASLTLNNLNVTGGTLNINNYSSTSYYPDGYLTVNGDLTLSGGVIDLMTVSSTSTNSIGNLTLLGDFTWSGGTLKRTNNSASPYTAINFTGTSGTQTFTQTLGSTTYSSSGRGITWSETGASLVDVTYIGTSGTANNLSSVSGNVLVNCSGTCTYATALTIASSKSLTVGSSSPVNSTARLDMGANLLTITGSTCSVYGFLRSSVASTTPIVGASTVTLTFYSGGTYESNATMASTGLSGLGIPIATWNSGSTCSIIGLTSPNAGGWFGAGINQTFKNFTWNCSAQSTAPNMSGESITCSETFTMASTGSSELRLGSSTNGSITCASYVQSGGTLNLSSGSGTGTLNCSGNFNQSGGTITESSSGNGKIIFNANSGVQSFTQSGSPTISNTINFDIGTGSTTNTLELATNVNLGSGTGTLTVANGSALDLKGYALTGSFGATINGTGVSNSGAFYTSTGTPSFARPITLGTSALIKSSGTSLTLTGGVVTASGKNLTIDGTGSTTFSTAAISGEGSVIKNGSGNLTYSFANTYTGSTTLNAGTLTLGANTAIATAATGGGVILNGGTYSSGASTGYTVGTSSLNMGTLTLTENTALSLGTGAHSIYFAASDAVGWTSGKTLTITGWTGTSGASGTAGKIFIGSSSLGLTSDQLAQISINGELVTQLSTGEIVPKAISFRSKQSGNWNDQTTWQSSADGSNWVNASSTPSNSSGSINILSDHNVTVSASVSVDELTVNSGGTLTINASQTLTIANGTGTDCIVNGTISNAGTITTTGTLDFGSTGLYVHNQNGGTVPAATWNASSICKITGVTSSFPSGITNTGAQTNMFGSFIWDCPNQNSQINFASGASTWTSFILEGNLTVNNTGSSELIIGGDASSYSRTFTVKGNFELTNTGTNANLTLTEYDDNITIAVNGNVLISSGTLNLSSYTISAGGPGNIDVKGNFTHTGGTITETGLSTTSKIVINGTTAQTIESTGRSNTILFSINQTTATGTCSIASGKTFVNSSGNFTVTDNASTSSDFTINGTFRNSAGTITFVGTTFSSTGTYEHNFTTTTGTIPTATWSSGSTCSIIGYTNTSVTINSSYGQSFSNFTWNCPSQSVAINLLGLLTTVNGNFNLQSAGTGSVTYNTNSPASPSLTIGGNCTINASINLNNGNSTPTFNIAGDFSQTAGTISKAGAGNTIINFNKSSGTQSFSQSGGTISNSINWNVGNGTSTNIMELASNVNLGTGTGTFTVLGNATLDAKTYVLSGSNSFTTNSGSNLITAHADGINGSITSTGTKTLNSNMNYTFNGSNAQTTGSLLTNANNITINNAAGVTMSTNASISGLLSLTNGKLSLGSTTLTLSNDVSGGSSTSYIVAYDNNGTIGKVKQSIPVTKQYIFPIGDPSVYAPVTVTFNSGTSLSSAFLEVYTKPSKVTGMSEDVEKVLNRSWIVEPSGITNPNYNIRYSYGSGEVVGDNTVDLVPVKFSVDTWYRPENSVLPNGTPLGDATDINTLPSNTLEWTGLTSFSEFGGAGGSSPLPVELTSFHASCEEEDVVLNWSTASENNSSHFDVEKSIDGENWRVIGTISAAGNSTQDIHYSFVDSEKSIDQNYYRLNQVDIDGKNEYFGPITVACEEDAKINTYPNPSKGEFNLVIHSKTNEKVTFKITEGNSRVISTKVLDLQNGINLFPIRENLSSGVYHIQLITESGKTTVLKHSVY